MKPIFCLIIFLWTIESMSCKKNDFDGVYINESGSQLIRIVSDTLTVNSSDIDEESLAVCTCRVITNSFLEINSICNPGIQALKNMSITYSKQKEEVESPHVLVRFHLPNTQREMYANIHQGMRDYKGVIKNGVCDISMDSKTNDLTKPFSFTITPIDYVESNPDGQYYGILYILYPFEIQYVQNDIIDITLPSVTNNLFKLYFIKGEYVHFTRDGLEWRGDIYYKQ